MDKAKLEGRLAALTENHKTIDTHIKNGYSSYMDDSGLSKMKQEKAHIKRQIEETREKLSRL